MKSGQSRAITKRDADIRAYFDANDDLYVDKYAVRYKAVCYERLELLETYLQARLAGPLTVLDVSCGASAFTDLLLDRFPRASTYCLDTSCEMLKRNAPGPRKKLVQSDARVLPFSSRSFDLINLDTLMHHLIDFTG